MKDRFKFRVWSDGDDDHQIVSFDDMVRGFHELHGGSYLLVEQCTVLKDKNGVLIYEGDIVLVRDYGLEYNWSDCACLIKYIEDYLTFCPFSKERLDWYNDGSNHFKYCNDGERSGGFRHFLFQYDSYELEIIGNIHENGDLLK